MLNVLVVDDSLIVRRLMNKFLVNLKYNVVAEATNGVEAVVMCKLHKPDLITMDITMPEMDGIDAVKAIREFDRDVHIIMSTSHGQEQMVLDSIKAGAKGYVLKPMTEEKLYAAITKVMPDPDLMLDDDNELNSIDIDEDELINFD